MNFLLKYSPTICSNRVVVEVLKETSGLVDYFNEATTSVIFVIHKLNLVSTIKTHASGLNNRISKLNRIERISFPLQPRVLNI